MLLLLVVFVIVFVIVIVIVIVVIGIVTVLSLLPSLFRFSVSLWHSYCHCHILAYLHLQNVCVAAAVDDAAVLLLFQ